MSTRAWPLFNLLEGVDSLSIPGHMVWEAPHDKAPGVLQRGITVPEGLVILTIWNNQLHEVVYQTPANDRTTAELRNATLFEHYGDGYEWRELLDNGFGKTYRRADSKRYALWSYTMDFNTFGTMEFHDIKWGT